MSGISNTAHILSSPIEYLKGVGPQRADLLKKELSLFTFKDLLEHYPYRHIDRTQVSTIASIHPATEYIQIAGQLRSKEEMGERQGKRLVAELKDATGTIDLVWFQGIQWMQKQLQIGERYLVFGKVSFFQGQPQLTHPEIELLSEPRNAERSYLEPVYPSTEKLKARGLGGRQLAKLTQTLFQQLLEKDLPEIFPESLLNILLIPSRYQAFQAIHFPKDQSEWQAAVKRLKFEELFFAQLGMALVKVQRHHDSRGVVFDKVGDLFQEFYQRHLPFSLTGAQKRVIKEIRHDCGRGTQMNRLLQGDVCSGKTIVALLVMLLAADNGFQSCLMAPTEILAIQHYNSLS
ncbi:MAG: OB-fold nucleic acid binding domain-containing protein, partial [Chitinophagaceae bacterium]